MTKSEMFKKAHEIARSTKEIAGSYKIAFSCALKDLHAGVMESTVEQKLEAAGAEIWENYGYKRIYLNAEIIINLGFKKASDGKWYKGDARINSSNMNAMISRGFFDCQRKCWNFSKCGMGGFASKDDQNSFVANV